MSAKSSSDDFPAFVECENQVIEFESTWSLEREYDKAVPIPTQTDPINKMEHKSTNTLESKDTSTQTEQNVNKTPVTVNEAKLTESICALSKMMEAEVKLGTTDIFTFQ